MKKLKHEKELVRAAIDAGVKYAEERGAAVFEPTDSASEKILYIYRLLVHDGKIMGDENDGSVELPLAVLDEIKHLFLHGDIQSRCGFITDKEFRARDKCHGYHYTLAHAPGEFMRIGMNAFFRFFNADFGQGVYCAVQGRFGFDSLMNFKWFGKLGGNFQVGVERSHRILENH